MSYSVILPSYNRPDMLKRSLASVYAQTVLPSQIYLTIDEPEDAEKYSFLSDYDDSLQVTYTGGGFGGAKARNVGLDLAESEFVFFLDDDDEWLPNKIEEQIQLLENRADCVAVTCNFLSVNSVKRTHMSYSESDINRCIRLTNMTGGFSCYGFRRIDALRGIRLVDDLASAQDFEFYIRVAVHGRTAVFNEAVVLFNQHAGSRITNTTLNKKRSTLYRVVKLNHDLFSLRERLFNYGRIESRSGACRAGTIGVFQYLGGSALLLLSLKELKLIFLLIMKNGWVLIRRCVARDSG